MPLPARGLVVFDLDGTLLRGPTVCEVLAAPLGRLAEMKAFESSSEEREIARARAEMARWYDAVPRPRLLRFLEAARWAPGAKEGVARLQEAGVEVAVASITWTFAVDWFAQRLGVKHTLATRLREDGAIEHVWGRQKADWLPALASQLAIPYERTAAVGDSSSDLPMLRNAALRFFVGPKSPSDLDCVHIPDADIRDVARHILGSWTAA